MALIETNFIRPQEVYDRNTGESKVRYRSYDGNDRFIPVVEGENGVPKTLVEVTHAELKAMRDAGKLTPGALYRITDYNCTTTQENTQSAGHQFDIVLLALSVNKLAEEGWAMMHDNIYDVTFADGVTKKCYIFDKGYTEGVHICNLVDAITLNGLVNIDIELLLIDEANKTATSGDIVSTSINDLDSGAIENCPYNYFQNSNLSAWKVWYCLDNDTARFAWADDREGYLISGQSEFGIWDNQLVLRAPDWDADDLYGWKIDGTNLGIWTKTLDINVGQLKLYNNSGDLVGVATVSSANKVYNGRGVIYRLIDEWNNDVGYDFKNIQFIRPMTDGKYDAQGTDTWVYTFNAYDVDNTVCLDCSMINGRDDIVSETEVCANNTIKAYINYLTKYELSYNSVVMTLSEEGEQIPYCLGLFIDSESYGNTIIENNHTISLYKCLRCSFKSNNALYVYFLENESIQDEEFAIYINNKKVLTEE